MRSNDGSRVSLPRWPAGAYCVLVSIVLLAPLDFYSPVQREPNGVRWTPENRGIELKTNGIVLSDSPAIGLHRRLVPSSGLSIEAWIATSDLDQVGPARIATYSLDKRLRNFTLGQDRDALVLRLRTTETDRNGVRPQTAVSGVFSTLDPIHLVVTCDHEATRTYVDGALVDQQPAIGGRFDNWDEDYRFALGNELTGNRPWQGTIHRLAIHDRAIEPHPREGQSPDPGELEGLVALYTFDEGSGTVVHDRSGSPEPLHLTIPELVATSNESFLRPPYLYFDPGFVTLKHIAEIAFNVAFFVPVGFLLYGSAPGRFRAPVLMGVAIVLGGLSLSLGAEVVQYFIRGRESSLGDLVHNGLGTVIGVMIATTEASIVAANVLFETVRSRFR